MYGPKLGGTIAKSKLPETLVFRGTPVGGMSVEKLLVIVQAAKPIAVKLRMRLVTKVFISMFSFLVWEEGACASPSAMFQRGAADLLQRKCGATLKHACEAVPRPL